MSTLLERAATDVSKFVDLTIWGLPAVYTPLGGAAVELNSIFESDFELIDLVDGVAVASYSPVAICATASLPTARTDRRGTTCYINGSTYYVNGPPRINGDVTLLILSKSPPDDTDAIPVVASGSWYLQSSDGLWYALTAVAVGSGFTLAISDATTPPFPGLSSVALLSTDGLYHEVSLTTTGGLVELNIDQVGTATGDALAVNLAVASFTLVTVGGVTQWDLT